MIFSPQWFTRHQKILLWFANSWIGRRILCINGNRSSVGKNKIIKILPNSITWKTGKKYHTEFRTHDKFAKRIYYTFYPLWKLLHLWDMFWYPNFNLGFDSTGNLYPAAGANSPVDGYCFRGSVNETFANIRAGVGTGAEASAGEDNMYLNATSTTNQYSHMRRFIFCFDTSSIGANKEINSATCSIWGTGKTNGNGSSDFHLASASLNSTSNIIAGDYQTCGTTSFGYVTYANYSTSGYNDITLNGSGLANINKTGVSQFSAQHSWDVLNNTTGLVWANGATTYFSARWADYTGTDNDPKLVVTYTLPMGGYIFISS
jgi:hypothetical protein